MKEIEVLVSTVNRDSLDFLNKMNLKTNSVVINQVYDPKIKNKIQVDYPKLKVITVEDVGLSKSRNLALAYASSDIAIITDDDVIFDDDYEQKIRSAYEEHPEADIIAFQVERVGNEKRKKTFRKEKSWENYLTSMKISSVEITFKREKIKENKIFFNENIGAGQKFYNGEENIFLYDALKKGLKVLYVPIHIAKVDVSESSWFEGYTPAYFEAVGAKFYNMSSHYYVALILQFAVRKYGQYKNKVSFFQAMTFMKKGVREYKKLYG